jgi:hypothetical protein
VWASPFLETVFSTKDERKQEPATEKSATISVTGDVAVGLVIVGELRRSYSELPMRLLQDLVQLPRLRESLASATPVPDSGQASLTRKR